MTGHPDPNARPKTRTLLPQPNVAGPGLRPGRGPQTLVATGIASAVLLIMSSTSDQRHPICADRPLSAIRPVAYRIDINRSTWIEWPPLDGVGNTLARRITANRQRNGRFATVEALQRVKGIGPRTIERLTPWLIVSRNTGPPTAVPQATSAQED